MHHCSRLTAVLAAVATEVFKKRTRDEIIAAFRESIRKKHEWQEKAEESIRKIREERLQFSI